ncbi:Uncharacterised protein [uncultured archaeon]|nr:Uncharacterised protein [uncultured archaeon]
MQNGEVTALISTFTIDGISIVLEREGKSGVILDFLNALTSSRGFHIYSPSMDDRIEAVSLMKMGLDYEDAITLQCAFANNIDEIMSLDRHFDKIKEIKRIEP